MRLKTDLLKLANSENINPINQGLTKHTLSNYLQSTVHLPSIRDDLAEVIVDKWFDPK